MRYYVCFLLALALAACGPTHAVELNLQLQKNLTLEDIVILKGLISSQPYTASGLVIEQYVDLKVTGTVAEAEAAASGQATALVSLKSDNEAVIAYEIADITVYDEDSITQSALEGTNLTLAEVNVTVNSSFSVQGIMPASNSYTADQLRTGIAQDLGIEVEFVSVYEVDGPDGSTAQRMLLQLQDSGRNFTVVVTTDRYEKAMVYRNYMSNPIGFWKLVTSMFTNGGAAPTIVAKVKTTFVSVTNKVIKDIFAEKLASITAAELTRRVNTKLGETGAWNPYPPPSPPPPSPPPPIPPLPPPSPSPPPPSPRPPPPSPPPPSPRPPPPSPPPPPAGPPTCSSCYWRPLNGRYYFVAPRSPYGPQFCMGYNHQTTGPPWYIITNENWRFTYESVQYSGEGRNSYKCNKSDEGGGIYCICPDGSPGDPPV